MRVVLPGAASVLRPGRGDLSVRRELRRRERLQHRRGPVLLAAHRARAADRLRRREPSERHDDLWRREAHGPPARGPDRGCGGCSHRARGRDAGTPSAIAATQNDPVHYYQRHGSGVSYDPTRTSLAGDAEELKFGKVGGGITRFETAYERRSQGFELNDLGFLRQADQQSWYTWFAFQSRHPGSFYQTAFWNFNWKQNWTAAGTPVERAANTNVHEIGRASCRERVKGSAVDGALKQKK